MIADNIYLYHLDAEVQKMYVDGYYSSEDIKDRVYPHFRNVARIAYLLCRKRLYVPFSNYLESPIAYSVLNELGSIVPIELNPLVFLSAAPSIKVALKKKEDSHRENFLSNPSFRYKHFTESGSVLPGQMQSRMRSASEDIKTSLLASVGDEGLWLPFKEYAESSIDFEDLQRQIAELPTNMAGQAYISKYMLPLLSLNPSRISSADRYMNLRVTRWYLESFLREFDAVCLKDIKFIISDDILPVIEGREHISYLTYVNSLVKEKSTKTSRYFPGTGNAFEFITRCSISELVEFKYSKIWEEVCLKNTMDRPHCCESLTIKERGSIVNQQINNFVNSPVVGSQIGTSISQVSFNNSDFSKELDQANLKLKSLEELSGENRKAILELLEQANSAIQSDDKQKQLETKATFEGFLRGIGNVGVKVVSVLSGLANIAKFFGYSP